MGLQLGYQQSLQPGDRGTGSFNLFFLLPTLLSLLLACDPVNLTLAYMINILLCSNMLLFFLQFRGATTILMHRYRLQDNYSNTRPGRDYQSIIVQ